MMQRIFDFKCSQEYQEQQQEMQRIQNLKRKTLEYQRTMEFYDQVKAIQSMSTEEKMLHDK